MAAHICRVDCDPQTVEYANGQTGVAHMMYASEPSSAAGRYQWEQNRAILDRGRRAWRASGQGQTRECRVWDERRRQSDPWKLYGWTGRRASERRWRGVIEWLDSQPA